MVEKLKRHYNMSDREIMDGKNGIVVRKSYGFRDEVVKNVVDKFVDRSNVGYQKYGQTLHTERTSGVKDLAAYLNDIQEELMDAILYIQAAREELEDIDKLKSFDENSYNGAEI
jgi:hypothetical protein